MTGNRLFICFGMQTNSIFRESFPTAWDARGLEACQMAVAAYEKDYNEFQFVKKDYPTPAAVQKSLAVDFDDAVILFQETAAEEESPLYVLIWGKHGQLW
jgi:hypothetical protein